MRRTAATAVGEAAVAAAAVADDERTMLVVNDRLAGQSLPGEHIVEYSKKKKPRTARK